MSFYGELPQVAHVQELGALIERLMERHGERRVLVDARALQELLDEETCDSVWVWLGQRSYHQMAVVLPQELAALGLARFNMTGVSAGLPLRAFAAMMDAHRWLDLRTSGERRHSSSMMQAVRLSSPPPSGAPASTAGPPGARAGELRRSGSTSSMPAVRPESDGSDPTSSREGGFEKKSSGYYHKGDTLEIMLPDTKASGSRSRS